MQAGVDGLLRDKTRPLAQAAARSDGDCARDRLHGLSPAERDDPLDRGRYGQSGRDQRQLGAAHLACSRPQAGPSAGVQTVQRPGQGCRQIGGCSLAVNTARAMAVLGALQRS